MKLSAFFVANLFALFIFSDVCTGFYVQPDVLFLSEHPLSQLVFEGADFSLNCAVQLRGLTENEGGLNVPVVWWSFNNTRISSDFAEDKTELIDQKYLRSTLNVREATMDHSGTYHCSVEDGTDKGGLRRGLGLCRNNPCFEFTTASLPATISVFGHEDSSSGESGVQLHLLAFPVSPLEGGSLSLSLISSGSLLTPQDDSLVCEWTRNDTQLCVSENSTVHSETDGRFLCGERELIVREVTRDLDSGSYCCKVQSLDQPTQCINIDIQVESTFDLFSPHNGTTFTTAHPSPITLTCLTPHTITLYWVYNGIVRPEWNGLTEVLVNTSDVGVYQCFVRNQFGYYAVATARIVPDGLTNPPGIPHQHELPRPDTLYRPAYFISWQPPNYPHHLDSANFIYSLSTIPTTTILQNNSTVAFIAHDSYIFLYTFVLEFETGHPLSELSPSLWKKFNDSRCYKLVYFPPSLAVSCRRGIATLSWNNNQKNLIYYPSTFYNWNGPIPGFYHINMVCYINNSKVLELSAVYMENGSVVFEEIEQVPLGSECVFSGGAIPPHKKEWSSFCLDPANILYSNTSCQTTAYIQFENSSYWADEAETFKNICMTFKGSHYTLKLLATYEDNTTEDSEVYVGSTSERVCVRVDLKDDEIVDVDKNISLSLQTDGSRISTGPSVILTVINDDVVKVGLSRTEYDVLAGDSVQVCVLAVVEGQLNIEFSVNLTLSLDSQGEEVVENNYIAELEKESLNFSSNVMMSCVKLSTNSSVTTTTSLELKLTHNGDPNVRLFNFTGHIKVRPKASTTELSLAEVVIMVSVLVPLLLVTATILCSLLLLRWGYIRHTGSFKLDIKFPEEPLEYHEYVPREMEFGSLPTLFEGLEKETAVPEVLVAGTEAAVYGDDGGESLMEPQMLQLSSLGEEEEETERLSTIPEARTTQSSLGSGQSQSHSGRSHSASGTSGSHHEYIASESILMSSYPPSDIGDGSGPYPTRHTHHHTHQNSSPQEVAKATKNITPPCLTQNVNTRHGSMDSGGLERGFESENGTQGSSGLARGGYTTNMDLSSDPDLSVFLGTVEDSGIDMDTNI